MKIAAATVLAVSMLAVSAQAQTAPSPATAGSDLTRDLNAGPPKPAVYLAPPPPPVETTGPAPERAAPPATVPRATPAPAVIPREAAVLPARAEPAAPPVEPAPNAPVPETAPETTAPPPAPAAPTITVLDATARAALPFSVDLPPGFEIVTGRPGPDFRIYTIRRGGHSFAMVYAGPASQFPIYSGQMVEAGGRASVVSTENGVRHAREHLFQRATAPREIHVWTMSLEGADRAMAEAIAQSLDVR
jgi:hypothetical protein